MERLFGGRPLMVALRLIVISIIVGVVLSTLGITPDNLLYRLELLIRRIYDLGFGAIDWVFGYFLLGALVVIPIWLISRAFGLIGGGAKRTSDKPGTPER